MAYVPTSEFQGEIESAIDQICKSLISQEKYCLEVSGWADSKKGIKVEKRQPNYEALGHVSPYLSIHYAPHIGHLVQYDQTFIGAITYWKPMEEHYITKDHTVQAGDIRISMNTIIGLKNFLMEITQQTAEQVRRLEKVLFCFET